MIKNFNYLFQSILIYLFLLIARIIGLKLSRQIFSFIFLSFAHIFKSKKVISENLYTYNKNISSSEKEKIIASMWKNYGMTFVEYIFLDKFKKSSSHIEIQGMENLKKIIDGKKQVIFISGHFANFELMSMEIKKKH